MAGQAGAENDVHAVSADGVDAPSLGGPRLPETAKTPCVTPVLPEAMTDYFKRLRNHINVADFEVVDTVEADGLYIFKRPVRAATGQGQMLNQAGTVFYHVLLYIKAAGKVTALDFGPVGDVDVTGNVMESVPCGPLVHENAVSETGQPLVRVKLAHSELQSTLMQKALKFAGSQQYHAINNNCIHTTDFLCRALTGGRLRNAPLIYDALAGTVPEQDHPLLMMFFLMTQLSWFHVCDGSPLTAAFMEHLSLGKASAVDASTAVAHSTPAAPSQHGSLRERPIDLAKVVQALQNGGLQNGDLNGASRPSFAG